MHGLTFPRARVKRRFGYREAWPVDPILVCYYEQGDSAAQYQALLARVVQIKHPDNHEGYELEQGGFIFYVFFSDWKMTVSRGYTGNQRDRVGKREE